MKNLKFTFLTLLVLSLSMISCSGDYNKLIVGKWKEVGTGESVSEYKADGTFEFNLDNGKQEKGTWRIESDNLYITYEGEEETADKIITLNEEKLVVEVAGMFQTEEIRIE